MQIFKTPINNSYLSLGEEFYQAITPAPVSKPAVFLWNKKLAETLGLTEQVQQCPQQLGAVFSGNQVMAGSTPVALAYAGHQFGHFNPQLGDGRAHLLCEVETGEGTFDIQLKGSGPTRFSRNGDGRCAFGPAIREFIMSEAICALGIPSTKTLAVVSSGDTVYRESASPGAVVTRVAASHVRVGTFEYFYAQNNLQAVQKLADYCIQRHYPELNHLSGGEKYQAFLSAVFEKHIELVCHWLRVGFIHGVMNTDNTTISGETIDYGPCAMMNSYNPNTVFSSIDSMGRYRFGHQPAIAQWNMARLAESVLPLLNTDADLALKKAEALVAGFATNFENKYHAMLAAKIGIEQREHEDTALIDALLAVMRNKSLDYTNTFNLLSQHLLAQSEHSLPPELQTWRKAWLSRLQQQGTPLEQVAQNMAKQNPVIIPRNSIMESVIAECETSGKANAAEHWLRYLRQPYQPPEGYQKYAEPPEDDDRDYQTFCGT